MYLSYEFCDSIADAYIPFLAGLSVVTFYIQTRKAGLTRAIRSYGNLTISIVIAYALMALDQALKIWPRFGLDYSTHTALGLAFVMYLTLGVDKRSLQLGAVLSFLLYVGLILFQQYHSPLDIITTAIVTAPLFAIKYRLSSSKALKVNQYA
ncbi:MAG: hypothetical protein ACI9BD_000942 [Candidatus Marinamargulisbacteria bacterium]|jgi:hypothetical protein